MPLADLVRQSIYSRLAGYEDVNDAKRLSQDPTFPAYRLQEDLGARSSVTSRLQSFETEVLTQAENVAGLGALNRQLIARADAIDSPRRVVLDMDSTEIPVHGQQEQSAYNGHLTRCSCSIAKANVWRKNCAPAASTAPRAEVLQKELGSIYGFIKTISARVSTNLQLCLSLMSYHRCGSAVAKSVQAILTGS